eukprot:307651_1
MTSARSRRCQGRDRQILKSFYDDLVMNHLKAAQFDDKCTTTMPFDKLLLYSLEYAADNVGCVVSSEKLNNYKSKTECIEEVLIHLMANNKINQVSLLLRTLYLNDDRRRTIHENMEIMVRSFLPIIRFLANHDELKLIHELFDALDDANKATKKQFSIAITTQKIELVLDDECAHLPLLKDFDCLKKSEVHRSNNEWNNNNDRDPVVDMIQLWKDYYFNNRHTNKAMMKKLYQYFVRKDTWHLNNSHFGVDKDENVRLAHYFMMDVICNDDIFDDTSKSNHFREVALTLFKDHYPDAHRFTHQFTKEQQNEDLQTVLRQL